MAKRKPKTPAAKPVENSTSAKADPAADTPEQRLLTYWSARCKQSAFAPVLSRLATSDRQILKGNPSLQTLRSEIAGVVINGHPLTRREYHLAIACGYLLTELPYEQFYRERWHENDERQGYGPNLGSEPPADISGNEAHESHQEPSNQR